MNTSTGPGTEPARLLTPCVQTPGRTASRCCPRQAAASSHWTGVDVHRHLAHTPEMRTFLRAISHGHLSKSFAVDSHAQGGQSCTPRVPTAQGPACRWKRAITAGSHQAPSHSRLTALGGPRLSRHVHITRGKVLLHGLHGLSCGPVRRAVISTQRGLGLGAGATAPCHTAIRSSTRTGPGRLPQKRVSRPHVRTRACLPQEVITPSTRSHRAGEGLGGALCAHLEAVCA